MREYFTALSGNEATRRRIGKMIELKRLPHALLIDGPSGSGKTTLATEIAAALNCEVGTEGEGRLPCGCCDSCRRIREGSFVDVHTIAKAADKATLGVNEIKAFRSAMFLSATESEHRIYIVKDAEKLTVEAQNALLTVLEEPPAGVVIILLANGCDRILTTIRSRTQYISMTRFSQEELCSYLESKRPELLSVRRTAPEKFTAALTAADGRIGRLIRLLDSKEGDESAEMLREIGDIIRALRPGTAYAEVYSAITSLPQKRDRFNEYLECLITAIRDMIAIKQDEDCTLLFFPDANEASAAADSISRSRLLGIYDLLLSAHGDNSKNANLSTLTVRLATEIHQI